MSTILRNPDDSWTGGTDPADAGLAHTVALAAIVRATNGNFRLDDRLVTQIRRVLKINGHAHLTPEAVDAAQEALLIGR